MMTIVQGSPQMDDLRRAVAAALKKKLGRTATSETIEGRGRVYRITDRLCRPITMRRPE